jgi:hypothetical protein
MVLLPKPEVPMMATISTPPTILRLISSTARTSFSSIA